MFFDAVARQEIIGIILKSALICQFYETFFAVESAVAYLRAAKNISFLETGIFFCEMEVLFTIGYIQYAICMQLYLLKRCIDKVTEGGLKVLKVSGNVKIK